MSGLPSAGVGGSEDRLAGWLLGLLTAFVWPAITTERQTVVAIDPAGSVGPNTPDKVAVLTRQGWVVTRVDNAGQIPIVQLERPSYVSVYEDLQERQRGSWCWLRTGNWH